MMNAVPTAAPSQSPQSQSPQSPQHMQALKGANRVRLARAALKRSVKAGELDAAEVVRSCPWEVETMTVAELLRSQSRWGRTRTNKFLAPLAVSENRQIGRLTSRQRDVLALRLEAKTKLTA